MRAALTPTASLDSVSAKVLRLRALVHLLPMALLVHQGQTRALPVLAIPPY